MFLAKVLAYKEDYSVFEVVGDNSNRSKCLEFTRGIELL